MRKHSTKRRSSIFQKALEVVCNKLCVIYAADADYVLADSMSSKQAPNCPCTSLPHVSLAYFADNVISTSEGLK